MTRSKARLHPVLQLLTTAFVLSAGQAAGAAEIAPYFHTWNGTLMAARQASGLDSAILAFGITHGTCVLDGSLTGMAADTRNFAAAGGQLMISFGGAGGTYVESACADDDQAFALMEKVMLDTGIRRFDFDVEGAHLLDTVGTARRSRVVARLQARYPDLQVSMSLPAWFNGFSQGGMEVLRTTIATGVRIDRVLVMAQSFGVANVQTLSPPTVGNGVITSFNAAAGQIAPLFPNKSQPQLYAMMGVTSMIGTNDDGSTFTLADADTLTAFVKANGIGLLSWWSFQRDRAQSTSGAADINTYSGVAQSDYQFFNAFRNAGGAFTPAPRPVAAAPIAPAAPVAAPAPTPPAVLTAPAASAVPVAAPAPAAPVAAAAPALPVASVIPIANPACDASPWAGGKTYPVASIVQYSGKLYIAKMWNAGSLPTGNIYGWSDWSPYRCGGSYTPTPAPSPTPIVTAAPTPALSASPTPVISVAPAVAVAAGTCNAVPWVQGTPYLTGTIVQYSGKLYTANMWNAGSLPTPNIYGWSDWSAYVCTAA